MPAERSRRPKTAIKWQDDGAAARTGNIMSDEGPNYRILCFAGALTLVSIALVSIVINFQRQGDSLGVIDEAHAAIMDDQPKVVSEGKAAPEQTVPGAKIAETKPVQAASAEPKPGVQAAAAAHATADTSKAVGGRVVASAVPKEAETTASVADLPKSDPRWTGDAAKKDQSAELAKGDAPLALAPVEMPSAAPRPQAAPRDAAIAAIDKAAERGTAKAQLGMRAVKVRSSVSMRSRPADGSSVITTVPGGTSVQVAENCRHWCSVVYKGQSGFIYKDFLSR